jgi:hypothetical protein
MNKLIRAFWFTTFFLTFGALLYSYAAIPVGYDINLLIGEEGISRDTYFYIGLFIISISNFSFYIMARKYKKEESPFPVFIFGWLMSFATVINFFLIFSMTFIQFVNSGENFNYTNFGYFIYITLGIVILWVAALPIFIIKLKNKA